VTTKGLDRLRGWASKLLAAGWLRTVLTSHHPAVNSRATDPTKPPTWVDELSQAMTSSDRRWSEADVLDVVAAAADLDAWLRDPRPTRADSTGMAGSQPSMTWTPRPA
jgi:hypothetical protein